MTPRVVEARRRRRRRRRGAAPSEADALRRLANRRATHCGTSHVKVVSSEESVASDAGTTRGGRRRPARCRGTSRCARRRTCAAPAEKTPSTSRPTPLTSKPPRARRSSTRDGELVAAARAPARGRHSPRASTRARDDVAYTALKPVETVVAVGRLRAELDEHLRPRREDRAPRAARPPPSRPAHRPPQQLRVRSSTRRRRRGRTRGRASSREPSCSCSVTRGLLSTARVVADGGAHVDERARPSTAAASRAAWSRTRAAAR